MQWQSIVRNTCTKNFNFSLFIAELKIINLINLIFILPAVAV